MQTSQYFQSNDSFGNRISQATSNQAFQPGSGDCASRATGNLFTNVTGQYASNNQLTSSSLSAPMNCPPGSVTSSSNGYCYDAAGDMTADATNLYLYDDEGRVCAVLSPGLFGGAVATQYIYDAEGRRVAKGTINPNTFNCDNSINASTGLPNNGFTLTNSYALGLDGEQVTETGGDGQWLHTNVFVGGQLLATYDDTGVHSHITDWLGSRRVQANYQGQVEATYQSLPFGEMVPQNDTIFLGATEQHFTGKERDQESGNDYFGARYYASSMGRFMSPDWSAKATPVPYAKMDNPQSLNLYVYGGNNPITNRDADGHVCIFGFGNTCGPSAPPAPPPPPATVAGAVQPRHDSVGPATGPMPVPHHAGETSGLGITVGGEAGTIHNGASASGNLNVAMSVKDGKPSVALVDNHVGVAYSGDKSVGTTQDGQPVVAGLSAGVSVTGFVSNAQSANDLIGPFQTQTLNLPFVSLQLSTSGDIHVFSMSVGASGGLSYSNITTETTVGCVAGCN